MLYDFTVHFPNANSDGLMNNWHDFGSNMKGVLSDSYNTNVNTGWPDDVEQILALLKILPAKAGRNTKSLVVPFIQAIDKLIIHSEVKFTIFVHIT